MDPAKRLGERIRAARHRRGLTLTALADKCSMDKAQLSRIEQGQQEPTLARLRSLARALDVSLFRLLWKGP